MSSAPKTIVGKAIGPTGFGLMGFGMPSHTATHSLDDDVKVMKVALNQGSNFWNGGTFYGTPDRNSLHLLKHYFATYPSDASKIVISIKGAYDAATHTPNGSPEHIRSQVDNCLSFLQPVGIQTLDLFQCARVDPNTPIETTVATFAELIQGGKLRGYGLSEVSASTIRKAHAVHPPAAVEIELSMFSREALEEGGVLDTCKELDIPVIGYGSLGKGWLTGQLKTLDDLPENDMRRHFPRFQPGAFEKNVELANNIEKVAKRKGVAVAPLAIAWCRQVAGVLPLPGASSVKRVEENMAFVELSEEEIKEIQGYLDEAEIVGDRYPASFKKLLSQ